MEKEQVFIENSIYLLVLVLSLWFGFLGVLEIKLLLAWRTKHNMCLS